MTNDPNSKIIASTWTIRSLLLMKLISLNEPLTHPQRLLKALGIASAVVGLLLVLAIGWLLNFSPLSLVNRPAEVPEIVRLVPRQSVAAVAVNAPLVDIERLRRYRTPLSQRRRVHRQWQNWFAAGGEGPLANFLAATHLQFERDMQPWLGKESLLAVTAVEAGGEPDYFVALSSRDVQDSNFLLNLVWQQQFLQQQQPQVEVYKGVQLLSVEVADREWVMGALGDRYVIFANRVEVAREAIDSWQLPELSLAGSSSYQSKLADLDSVRVGLAYFNFPEMRGKSDWWGFDTSQFETDGEASLVGIGVNDLGMRG